MKFKLINIYAAQIVVVGEIEEILKMDIPPQLVADVTCKAIKDHGLDGIAHMAEKVAIKEESGNLIGYKLYVYRIKEEDGCEHCQENSTAEEAESAESQGVH